MRIFLVTGISFIAVCYAFARFSFGLFVPEIQHTFHWNGSEAGFAQSISYLSYTISLFLVPFILKYWSERLTLLFAMICAIIGMIGMFLAPSTLILLISMAIAGVSTGFASPVMGQLVMAKIDSDRQNHVNTWINSGTSFGIIITGLIYFALNDYWRVAYFLFAVLACIVGVVILYRKEDNVTPKYSTSSASIKAPIYWPLIYSSLLIGLSCAIYWTYAITHLQENQFLSQRTATAYWIVLGVAGIVGGTAGKAVRFMGIKRAYSLSVLVLCISIAIIPLSIPIWSLVSMLGFGAAYIFVTGIYVVWGIAITPEASASQISRAFLALGLGQFIGSWLAGLLIVQIGLNIAFIIFACIGLFALLYKPDSTRILA